MRRSSGACVGDPSLPPQSSEKVAQRAPVGDNGRDNAVSGGTIRYRLALLAFDDRARLSRAVADLLRNGLVAQQLAYVGRPATLELLGASEGCMSSRATLVQSPEHAMRPARLDEHGGVAARIGSNLLDLVVPADAAAASFGWMQESLRPQLAPQARDGAIILLVGAASAGQHALIARLLLRHGEHDLQMHEFTRAAVG